MLLRQLQRPLSRSVAAAAWRSVPTATALFHGSRRCLQPPSQPDDDHRNDDAKKSSSLLEKLFPDDARHARTQPHGTLKSSWESQFEDEPPPLTMAADEHLPEHGNNELGNLDSRVAERIASEAVALRAHSMLILSAASKHLLESDFLRLGQRGAHVEGWVGGILRVIQARDPDTLAPLGHYFVLFDSRAAAAAYKSEVEALWQLSKKHMPDAQPGKYDVPVPQGLLRTDNGQDVAVAIRSFTLVPPSQKWHLELGLEISDAHSRDKMDDLDMGGASFVDQLMTKAGSKHLVLVTVDGGRISVDTLRQAIEEDGVDRNLPWRVTDLVNGILPFGKSILKKHDMDDKSLEQSLLDQAGRATGRSNKDAADGEEETTHDIADDRKYRRYPRFIVPFTDNAEAYRFVRNWHRRQLKLRMNVDGGRGQTTWDETRILNVSVLW